MNWQCAILEINIIAVDKMPWFVIHEIDNMVVGKGPDNMWSLRSTIWLLRYAIHEIPKMSVVKDPDMQSALCPGVFSVRGQQRWSNFSLSCQLLCHFVAFLVTGIKSSCKFDEGIRLLCTKLDKIRTQLFIQIRVGTYVEIQSWCINSVICL